MSKNERAQPVGRDNPLTGLAISDVGLPLDGAFSFEENRRPRVACLTFNVRQKMHRDWIRTDFNALIAFGGDVFLSVDGRATTEGGEEITLKEGMVLTVFETATDEEGRPDDLCATGVVFRVPHPRHTSIWVLKIDASEPKHESERKKA